MCYISIPVVSVHNFFQKIPWQSKYYFQILFLLEINFLFSLVLFLNGRWAKISFEMQ